MTLHEIVSDIKIVRLEKQIEQMQQELPEQLREAFIDGAITSLKSLRKDSDQYGIIPNTKAEFKEFLRKRYPDYKKDDH